MSRTNDAYTSCKIRYRLNRVVFGGNKLHYMSSHWVWCHLRDLYHHCITNLRPPIFIQDVCCPTFACISPILLSNTNHCYITSRVCLNLVGLVSANMSFLLRSSPWLTLVWFFDNHVHAFWPDQSLQSSELDAEKFLLKIQCQVRWLTDCISGHTLLWLASSKQQRKRQPVY